MFPVWFNRKARFFLHRANLLLTARVFVTLVDRNSCLREAEHSFTDVDLSTHIVIKFFMALTAIRM